MRFTLDVNQLFNDAMAAMSGGIGVGIVFGVIALIMSPWLIPALSKAIAEQRALSHKREQNLLKIRNSLGDRRGKSPTLAGPKAGGVGKGGRK